LTPRAAGDLLSLDPSIRSCGVALFRRGILVAAKRLTRATSAACTGERAAAMALDVLAWLVDVRADPSCIAHEWPQIYRATKSKGDPNDLIAMAGVATGVATGLRVAAAARNRCVEIVSYEPDEWCGQLPKVTKGDPWASPRGQRIASRLQPEERLHVPAQHDVLDGVGIGLKALERFERVRCFPGAT
jgi:hypothetical protein